MRLSRHDEALMNGRGASSATLLTHIDRRSPRWSVRDYHSIDPEMQRDGVFTFLLTSLTAV